MITPTVTDRKVVFGPCRLSYTHVFIKYVPNGGDEKDGKYMTNILIPKSETETINALNEAINNAKKEGTLGKWGGKEPRKLDIALRDGDEKEDELYHGHYYINAKASTRPGIIDKNYQQIFDEEEIYSGVWAVMSITFYAYAMSGNNGIAAGLNNLMKFKDDEHLGGRVSADRDFAGLQLPSVSDDDL